MYGFDIQYQNCLTFGSVHPSLFWRCMWRIMGLVCVIIQPGEYIIWSSREARSGKTRNGAFFMQLKKYSYHLKRSRLCNYVDWLYDDSLHVAIGIPFCPRSLCYRLNKLPKLMSILITNCDNMRIALKHILILWHGTSYKHEFRWEFGCLANYYCFFFCCTCRLQRQAAFKVWHLRPF